MQMLEGTKVVVTGGSRGLGLGIVEALVARKARVTVVARDEARLAEVARRLGVHTIRGDVTDTALPREVLAELRPSVLILNAGMTRPPMGPVHELEWDDFSAVWNHDVKAGFHWVKQALRLPLPPGSRVLLGSSGAALNGSPLSGGYAGAKRMLWFLARYGNFTSDELGLGLRFQALVPMQMIPETDHGRYAATTYARRKGVPVEKFVEAFGAPMSPRQVGEHVAAILTDPAYEKGVAFGVKGDTGIVSLDA
jgi:NAD(P)-dependent dehydrogenase (short-subunit alcohol dehydrogenase family)